MRVSNAMVEQIIRAGGASYNQKTFALLAADLRDERAENARLQARITELEGKWKREECAHCDERPGGYVGTIYCEECLRMYQELERNEVITELRARIAELEGRSGCCVECERLARRVEELEAQLAGDAK